MKLRLYPLVPVVFEAVRVTAVGAPYSVSAGIVVASLTSGVPAARAGSAQEGRVAAMMDRIVTAMSTLGFMDSPYTKRDQKR